MATSPVNIAAVVLAGGFGTRIRHLLTDLPKPMAPVLDRPFLEWVVRYLARQGIRHVVLSTGYLGDEIEAHFAARSIAGVRITWVREPEPLGTGGGFLHAVESSALQPEAWLVLNGDSLAFANLAELAALAQTDGVDGALVGLEADDASRYGTIAFDAQRNLRRFEEKRPGRGVINAGIYLFRAGVLNRFPKNLPLSFERDVFPALLRAGLRLQVCISKVSFLDIGTPESLSLASAFIQNNLNQFAKT